MRMKTIDEDIKKGTFRQSYLLYGEEAYLKKQYRDKLIAAMVKQGDTMNFASYEGKGIVVGELIDLAETLPFFAERRVILVEESGFFKQASEALAAYLSQISPGTCLIFVESEVDRRSKTYKAIKKSGAVAAFEKQSEALLSRWVLGRIGKEGKKIAGDALNAFFDRTGTDMSCIDRELEKLFCYTLEKEEILPEDVKAIVTERAENRIFEMTEAIAGRNRKRALDLYRDLLALKEAPMRILYLMVRQFRILLEIKEMSKRGYGSADIASRMKIPEFAVRKHMKQTAQFSTRQLLAALEAGAAAEESVKCGRMQEKIAVELYIMEETAKF